MSGCALCSKHNIPVSKTHVVYTAVEQKAEIKTGFKQYEIRTRWYDPQKHTFDVCIGCEERRKWLAIYQFAAAVLLALVLPSIPWFYSFTEGMTLLCAWLPLLAGAYYLNTEFFSVDAKLKQLAVNEHQKTSWGQSFHSTFELDPRYQNPRSKNETVIALSTRQYEKKFKQAANS